MDAERIQNHPLAWAKEALGMDDETWNFILYECDGNEKAIMACMEGLGVHKNKQISQKEKKNLRGMAVELLQQEVALRNLPAKATMSRLARELFGIDRVEWLRMDQIGELIWTLRRRSFAL